MKIGLHESIKNIDLMTFKLKHLKAYFSIFGSQWVLHSLLTRQISQNS